MSEGITDEQARDLAQRWQADVGGPIIGSPLTNDERESLLGWVRAWCEADDVDEWAVFDLAEALSLTHEQAASLGEAAGWKS